MIFFAPIIGAMLGAAVLWWFFALGAFGWALYAYSKKNGEYQRLKAAVRQRVDELVVEAKAGHGRIRSANDSEAA